MLQASQIPVPTRHQSQQAVDPPPLRN
ncbi:hypothetical protein SMALA_1522 [Streptomyces malaysiensis subsp. malaysiensis]|nr:hypothetical protein SMALA_1522 [Streptomyces malaysiensis]